MTTMTVPFVDLGRTIAPDRAAIDAAIARVLDSRRFILGPEVDAVAITPIAVHTLSFRPIAVSGSSVIELRMNVAWSSVMTTSRLSNRSLMRATAALMPLEIAPWFR